MTDVPVPPGPPTLAETYASRRRPGRVVIGAITAVLLLGAMWSIGYCAARLNRAACVDDVEVEWRIAFGEGLVHLVDPEAGGELDDDVSAAEAANAQLIEVQEGERCPSPGWIPRLPS